jgi:hypothetical protein
VSWPKSKINRVGQSINQLCELGDPGDFRPDQDQDKCCGSGSQARIRNLWLDPDLEVIDPDQAPELDFSLHKNHPKIALPNLIIILLKIPEHFL